MHTLIDFPDENQAEYLNSALRRHGLDSYVFKTGVSPDGNAVFSITCFQASELKQARHLIYSSRHFIGDIHPEAASTLREIRYENNKQFLNLLTAKPALIISSLALIAGITGYLIDL